MPVRKKARRLKTARTPPVVAAPPPPTATTLIASMNDASLALGGWQSRLRSAFAMLEQFKGRPGWLDGSNPVDERFERYWEHRMLPFGVDLKAGRFPRIELKSAKEMEDMVTAIEDCISVALMFLPPPPPPPSAAHAVANDTSASSHDSLALAPLLSGALAEHAPSIEAVVTKYSGCLPSTTALLKQLEIQGDTFQYKTNHTLSSREPAGLPTGGRSDIRKCIEELEAMVSVLEERVSQSPPTVYPPPIDLPVSSTLPMRAGTAEATPTTPAQAQAPTAESDFDPVVSLLLNVSIQIVSLELLAMDFIHHCGVAIGRVTTTAVVQTLAWVSVLLGFVPTERRFLATAKLEIRLHGAGILAWLVIVPVVFVVAVFVLPAYRLYEVVKITLHVATLIKKKTAKQQRANGIDK